MGKKNTPGSRSGKRVKKKRPPPPHLGVEARRAKKLYMQSSANGDTPQAGELGIPSNELDEQNVYQTYSNGIKLERERMNEGSDLDDHSEENASKLSICQSDKSNLELHFVKVEVDPLDEVAGDYNWNKEEENYSSESEESEKEIMDSQSIGNKDFEKLSDPLGGLSDSSPDENPLPEQCRSEPNPEELQLLQEASFHIGRNLPPHWLCAVIANKLLLGFTAVDEPLSIQRSISVLHTGEIKLFVHNKLLPSSHKLWESITNIPLLSDIQPFSENILKTVESFRSFAICRGTQDYEPIWKYCDLGYVDENPFLEVRYRRTYRSFSCLYLVDKLTIKRCPECSSVCTILRKRQSRTDKQRSDTPPPSKGHKYLNESETKKRLILNRKTIRNLRDQNVRLMEKVKTLLGEEEGEPAGTPSSSE